MRICLAQRPYGSQSNRRNPNPNYLADQNAQALVCEEAEDAQWRCGNWTEGKQVPRVIEWCEKRNAQSAVGQGIQEAMRGSGEEDIKHEPDSDPVPGLSPERNCNDGQAQCRRKGQ